MLARGNKPLKSENPTIVRCNQPINIEKAITISTPILENMYVKPKNFGVAPDDLRQLLAYFAQLFGQSNRWRGVRPNHFKNNISCRNIKIKKDITYLLFLCLLTLFCRPKNIHEGSP